MKTPALLLLFALPCLAACAADPDATEAPAGKAQATSTFQFVPEKIVATRMPFEAGCQETNAPFTDADVFTLQPVGSALVNTKVKSIAITFHRTVRVDAPLELELGGPTGGAIFPDAEQAHALDEKTGADVVVFPVGTKTPLSSATVTVLGVPTKDGDPLEAHVELHFENGDVLSETFAGALESYAGACASP